MTLQDNTLLSFGPNTEFVVDEYLYAPGKGDLKRWATLTKGTLQYVSGIIGVRGTRFLVHVDDEGVKVAEAAEATP